tara:strand:+ start:77 stop:481 length:405 start_codon:yes stop_codon:yes gene_type:complete
MDYEKFRKEYEDFDEYMKQSRKEFILDSKELPKPKLVSLEGKHSTNDAWMDLDNWIGQKDVISTDRVNHPSHYTRGTQEAIDIIEDAIQDAPSPVEGMLQAQALKYLLRLWLKDDPKQDARKAAWYLERLIEKL